MARCQKTCVGECLFRYLWLGTPSIVSIDIASFLCLQTTLGLKHVHSRNVLHRDIKSLNLLLDASMQVKIADLGIAAVSGVVDWIQTWYSPK